VSGEQGPRESALRSISVVIETINEASGPKLDLDDVLSALSAQTYAKDKVEIIVVIDRGDHRLIDRVRTRWPDVVVLEIDEPTYFSMKTHGAGAAAGDIIAFLDSDCVPVDGWLERIAARIEAGADVVAGKTRYPERARFARTFNFFNFGYIGSDSNGRANGFLPNNVAFRREVFLEHPFDPRIRRGGAGHLLGNKLKTLGYVLVYEPGQRVVHNCYEVGDELLMRVKSGYDTVNLAEIDVDEAIEESRYLHRSTLSIAAIFLRRVAFDVRATLRNRRDLDITPVQIPYFLLISPLIRGLEMAAALITVLRPSYFKDKYDW
jgi:glycosyltransferase involved in cell wall biosynthesis